MILRNMIKRFQSRLDDSAKAYWNDERAKTLANTVMDRLVVEFGVIAQLYYTFNSVQGQQNYQVPSNFIASHYLYFNGTNNREIVIVDSPRDIYGPTAEVTQEGTPTMGYIWGVSGRRQLTIYPTFNVDDIELMWWFWGTVPELEGDNDEPMLPVEWHPSIVEAMVDQAMQDDKFITVGDRLILWENMVKKLKRLDSMKAAIEIPKQHGSVEDSFPSISEGQYFRISGREDVDGVIW